MKDDLDKKEQGPLEARAEPPVVARLILEIRSDGTRTIARGLAEDVERGERVKVEAEGANPLQLVLSLLKSLKDVPALARSFARGLLPGRRK
ncbi:MAG TPA: hypothetical protein VFE90_01755 [Myxococcales bacterium]|jgi:hypothetical protein|nr:hypothetical protein [Myxococcales bacterium]